MNQLIFALVGELSVDLRIGPLMWNFPHNKLKKYCFHNLFENPILLFVHRFSLL